MKTIEIELRRQELLILVPEFIRKLPISQFCTKVMEIKDNKKFLEELMAYFPIVRNGRHRKRERILRGMRIHREQSDLTILVKDYGE
jgi:hypothetical protein